MIVKETRFRQRGGTSRDSILAAELPADAAPLLAALRGLDRVPPRPLHADSFALGVPVLLTDSADLRRSPDGWGPITLSRVVYNADSTRALVHAVKPCRKEREPSVDDVDDADAGPEGMALLAALDRQPAGWKVARVVWLSLE
jgi:hypothetical protein